MELNFMKKDQKTYKPGSLGLKTATFGGVLGQKTFQEKVELGLSRGMTEKDAMLAAKLSVIDGFFRDMPSIVEIESPLIGNNFKPNVLGGAKYLVDVGRMYYEFLGTVNANRFKVTPAALAADEYGSATYLPSGGVTYIANLGFVVVGTRADRTLGSSQLSFGTKVATICSPTDLNIATIPAGHDLATPKETLTTGEAGEGDRLEVYVANVVPFWFKDYSSTFSVSTEDSTNEALIAGAVESAFKCLGEGWNLSIYPVVPGANQMKAWQNLFAAGPVTKETWRQFCLEIISSVING